MTKTPAQYMEALQLYILGAGPSPFPKRNPLEQAERHAYIREKVRDDHAMADDGRDDDVLDTNALREPGRSC